MEKLKIRFHDETNDLDYVPVGDYYLPDLILDEQFRSVGYWGRRYRQHLLEYHPVRYQTLLLSGKLNSYLFTIDGQMHEQLNLLIQQMANAEGVTEELKAENNRIGTIGMPMSGVTAGIADDGELCVRGHLVCRGYHNHPDVTAEQIVDGWLHTGDLGDIDEDGFISITGRKKDLIITAGGKNVSPGLLEAAVMTSPVVNQCLVIGDRKPFVAALVTLDLADANAWLKSQGAQEESDLASLARNPIVHTEVERAVNQANEGVSRAESIRKFEILPDEFTQDNGMLTASLKTRRAQIVAHYRELIDTVIYVPKKK